MRWILFTFLLIFNSSASPGLGKALEKLFQVGFGIGFNATLQSKGAFLDSLSYENQGKGKEFSYHSLFSSGEIGLFRVIGFEWERPFISSLEEGFGEDRIEYVKDEMSILKGIYFQWDVSEYLGYDSKIYPRYSYGWSERYFQLKKSIEPSSRFYSVSNTELVYLTGTYHKFSIMGILDNLGSFELFYRKNVNFLNNLRAYENHEAGVIFALKIGYWDSNKEIEGYPPITPNNIVE